MGHLMNFNTYGYINSYGLFEAYYISNLGLSASVVAWIGSVQIFLLFFLGTFSGRALDAGYLRYMLIAGNCFQLLGIFMTSFCRTFWQLFLAQGLCQGLGNGLVFCPTISLVSTYFVRKRSLVIAIVAGGSATGGVVFPIIAERLLPRLGFPWTVRVMGFVFLANSAMILSLARTRLPPRKSGPVFDIMSFKELPYTVFVVGVFIMLLPVYSAYDYVSDCGENPNSADIPR
jgi:MFS family permease